MAHRLKTSGLEAIPFLSQSLSFKAYKKYIVVIFTRFVLKLYKNKNIRFSFKAYTADNG